jgi:hypothetical protein
MAAGWRRHAFGDIIKRIFDPLVRQYFGFSAHTLDRAEKAKIRGLLVHGGEAFYEAVFAEYFADLAPPLVNTRLMRLREAQAWTERGGVIVEVKRPGVEAAEPCERVWLEDIRAAGFIRHTIHNGGTVKALHQAVCALAGVPFGAGAAAREVSGER